MPQVLTTTNTNPAAQEQAAMHRTGLLLARCRGEQSPCAPMVDAQAHWHARQQTSFLAWLDAGGFRAPGPIENSGIAPLFSAP